MNARSTIFSLLALLFCPVAYAGSATPTYRQIIQKADLIIWARLQFLTANLEASGVNRIQFDVSDADVLHGSFKPPLVIYTKIGYPPPGRKEYPSRPRALFLLKAREGGGYEPIETKPPLSWGVFDGVEPGRSYANFADLVADFLLSEDAAVAFGTHGMVGQPHSKPWESSQWLDAMRRLARSHSRTANKAGNYIEKFENTLLEDDYAKSTLSEVVGPDLIRFQLLRFQAAWNRRNWSALTSLYSPAKGTESVDSLAATWERDGELIRMDIHDVVMGESTAEAKGSFTYTKAGTRKGSFTFSRSEEGWIITSRPR